MYKEARSTRQETKERNNCLREKGGENLARERGIVIYNTPVAMTTFSLLRGQLSYVLSVARGAVDCLTSRAEVVLKGAKSIQVDVYGRSHNCLTMTERYQEVTCIRLES